MKSLLFLFALVLASCSGKQWSARHPHYLNSPSAEEEIALVGLHRNIVVSRDKWFSKNLGIPRDSVYFVLGRQIEESFVRELRDSRYPRLSVWPDSFYEKFPEDTQKLDERIYVKGRFPEQGVVLRGPDGKSPRHLILIHECTFGLDLSKDNLYDYALVNREEPERRTSKALTIILSYSLWDNEKQRALYSAVAEVPYEIPRGIVSGDVEKVSAAAADSLARGIDSGAR